MFVYLYISVTLVQYNPMFLYVLPSCLHNCCTILWPKCVPEDDYGAGLSIFCMRQIFTIFAHQSKSAKICIYT